MNMKLKDVFSTALMYAPVLVVALAVVAHGLGGYGGYGLGGWGGYGGYGDWG